MIKCVCVCSVQATHHTCAAAAAAEAVWVSALLLLLLLLHCHWRCTVLPAPAAAGQVLPAGPAAAHCLSMQLALLLLHLLFGSAVARQRLAGLAALLHAAPAAEAPAFAAAVCPVLRAAITALVCRHQVPSGCYEQLLWALSTASCSCRQQISSTCQ